MVISNFWSHPHNRINYVFGLKILAIFIIFSTGKHMYKICKAYILNSISNFVENNFQKSIIFLVVVNAFPHAAIVCAGDESESEFVKISKNLQQFDQSSFHVQQSNVVLGGVKLDTDLKKNLISFWGKGKKIVDWNDLAFYLILLKNFYANLNRILGRFYGKKSFVL